MTKTELLAPAGNLESLRAAIAAGADAVYLGASAFSARAQVGFDAATLKEAIDFAHFYGRRVYVAVNTLIKQREWPQLTELLEQLSQLKPDAVLVQDLGVLSQIKESCPSLQVHASTQMAIHNATGARFLLDAGISRVVAARECSLDVIRSMAETGMEIEVFVHGALCVSVSGQCLLSSQIGGRSGNRGRCAQPCRQEVCFQGDTAAYLSLRDLCLRDRLPELAAAGVASLKIEGRLKRPEYVAVVTRAYRNALDALRRGDFAPAEADERKALMQIFQRGGFTQGHAFGAEDAALACPERVNHGGVPLGDVRAVRGALAEVLLTETLRNDDSVQLRGDTDVELRYAGPERLPGETALLRLREPEAVRPGDAAFKLADAQQLAEAARLHEPRIPATLRAELFAGRPARLTLSDGETSVTVTGEAAQAPRTRACTEAEARKQLQKLGDTPFSLQSLDVALDEMFLPVSALNALRRDGADRLAQARADAFYGKPIPPEIWPFSEADADCANANRPSSVLADEIRTIPTESAQTFAMLASSPDAGAGPALLAAGATAFAYAPDDFRPEALEPALDRLPPGSWLQLPAYMPQADLDALLPLLRARPALGGVILGSVGQLGQRFPTQVALGSGVPVCSPLAYRELSAESFAFFTLWPEWSADELLPMQRLSAPRLLCVYGRETLMLLHHCPARTKLGLTRGHADCHLCDRGAPGALRGCELTDRRGYRFPLARTRLRDGCVVNVLGALPVDLSACENKRLALGAGMWLRFTTENAAEQERVTRRFAALQRGETPSASEGPTTKGLFLRGAQ